jgi:hypothetical protein
LFNAVRRRSSLSPHPPSAARRPRK